MRSLKHIARLWSSSGNSNSIIRRFWHCLVFCPLETRPHANILSSEVGDGACWTLRRRISDGGVSNWFGEASIGCSLPEDICCVGSSVISISPHVVRNDGGVKLVKMQGKELDVLVSRCGYKYRCEGSGPIPDQMVARQTCVRTDVKNCNIGCCLGPLAFLADISIFVSALRLHYECSAFFIMLVTVYPAQHASRKFVPCHKAPEQTPQQFLEESCLNSYVECKSIIHNSFSQLRTGNSVFASAGS